MIAYDGRIYRDKRIEPPFDDPEWDKAKDGDTCEEFYDTPNLPYRKCACRNRVIVMAKDDYFVIVYKILAYLYARLKKGEPVEAEMLIYDGGLFQINREYWVYIIDNMLEQGYIKGLHNVRAGNGYYIKEQLSNCSITPKGIDYLCENSLLEKAKQFLKDVKEITPFI